MGAYVFYEFLQDIAGVDRVAGGTVQGHRSLRAAILMKTMNGARTMLHTLVLSRRRVA